MRVQKSIECACAGAASVLATKISIRVSLSSIQLPRRRVLPNRPADNTRWTAKWTLGFHGIPADSRACKKQRYEAIKRSWAAIERRSPSDLVMSESPPWRVKITTFDPWVTDTSLACCVFTKTATSFGSMFVIFLLPETVSENNKQASASSSAP